MPHVQQVSIILNSGMLKFMISDKLDKTGCNFHLLSEPRAQEVKTDLLFFL